MARARVESPDPPSGGDHARPLSGALVTLHRVSDMVHDQPGFASTPFAVGAVTLHRGHRQPQQNLPVDQRFITGSHALVVLAASSRTEFDEQAKRASV